MHKACKSCRIWYATRPITIHQGTASWGPGNLNRCHKPGEEICWYKDETRTVQHFVILTQHRTHLDQSAKKCVDETLFWEAGEYEYRTDN